MHEDHDDEMQGPDSGWSRLNRRNFLKVGFSSLAWFAAHTGAPRWFAASAEAAQCGGCFTGDKILVVLQMAGGNDGLNTVIPRTDPVYYDALTRPTIRIPSGTEISIDGLNGLHPALVDLADWFQRGMGAVLHRVGYVNPNLSHFTATDYYELGVAPGQPLPTDGWLARYYDHHCSGCEVEALRFATTGTSSLPKSMIGATGYVPPAINDPATYQFSASNDAAARLASMANLNSIATSDPALDFLQKSFSVAADSIADIGVAQATPLLVAPGAYSADSLGRGLQLVSQVIRAGLGTKVFYVTQGGYDTHAAQVASGAADQGFHAGLLGALNQSLDAFLTEMELSGNLDRVVVMTYSEFGRRVKENGSLGTDHGAANCSFVFGGPVIGGVYGGQPDLVNLISGSLAHNVDFRAVYSRALQGLFGASTREVFGEDVYNSIIVPDMAKVPFLVGSSSLEPSWAGYR